MIAASDIRRAIGGRPEQVEDEILGLKDEIVDLWESATLRPWRRATRVEVHRVAYRGVKRVWLRTTPVESVTLVEVRYAGNSTWTALTSSDWIWRANREVESLVGTWTGEVRVTYLAGYRDPDDATAPAEAAVIPGDVKRALLVQILFARQRHAADKIATRSKGGVGGAFDSFLSPDIHPAFRLAATRHRRLTR